jgi:hypothetical protein
MFCSMDIMYVQSMFYYELWPDCTYLTILIYVKYLYCLSIPNHIHINVAFIMAMYVTSRIIHASFPDQDQ